MSRVKSRREAAGHTGESRLDINWQDCQEAGSKSQILILVSQLGQRSVRPAQEGGQPKLTSTMGSLLVPPRQCNLSEKQIHCTYGQPNCRA